MISQTPRLPGNVLDIPKGWYFLVRFQEFVVAQPHLSNKMETPHDSPVSLTGKDLKDGQMGLLHTRPGFSWKNGGNMLEKWLPGMAWCFTVQIYSPKIYTVYLYIKISNKIVNYTGPVLQICFPKHKLEQLCVFTTSFTAWWILSRRLGRTVDLLSESERFMSWGHSTSSWFVDFWMQKPFQEPGISWKKRENVYSIVSAVHKIYDICVHIAFLCYWSCEKNIISLKEPKDHHLKSEGLRFSESQSKINQSKMISGLVITSPPWILLA